MARKAHPITLALAVATAAAIAGAAPRPAEAQELYTYSISALGGIGGALSADRGDGLDRKSLQVGFSVVTDPATLVGVRVGQIAFGDDEPLENLLDADLTYVTLGGEYRFQQAFYRSGVYIGLGGYRLEGTDLDTGDVEDTAIGLAIGFTGEFELNRHLGVLLEFSGHWADLDETQAFGLAHAGLAVHF